MNEDITIRFENFLYKSVRPYIEQLKKLENTKHEFTQKEIETLMKVKKSLESYEKLETKYLKKKNKPDSLIHKEIRAYQKLRDHLNQVIQDMPKEHEGHEVLKKLKILINDCEDLIKSLKALES